jgi:hypothetical protein
MADHVQAASGTVGLVPAAEVRVLIRNLISEIGQGAHNPVAAPFPVPVRHALDPLLDLAANRPILALLAPK